MKNSAIAIVQQSRPTAFRLNTGSGDSEVETDTCSVPIETIFSHATTGGEIDALATLTRHVTILCRSDPLQTKGLMDFISSSIAT